MIRVLGIVLVIAVTVYAISDLVRTPAEQMPMRIPRAFWLVLIVLLMPFGGIAWIVMRAVTKAENGMAMPEGEQPTNPFGPMLERAREKRETPKAPPEPVAPDDDPEFLFKLERDIRRERQRKAQEGDSSTPTEGNPATDAGAADGGSAGEADGNGDGPDGSSGDASGTDPDPKSGPEKPGLY